MAVMVCTSAAHGRMPCGAVFDEWDPRIKLFRRGCPDCNSPWWVWREATAEEQTAYALGGAEAVTVLLGGFNYYKAAEGE